jgi:hypothetical protein
MHASIRQIVGLLLLLTALLMALASCNMPGVDPSSGATATGDANATAAAETVAAELTRAAEVATDIPPTSTHTPSATATEAGPSATPEPTGCTDKATFVQDVTVPDDTYFEPGEDFTKTWRLRNSGTCIWTSQYSLVFDQGKSMDGPASVPLAGNVPPGATVDLSVDLTAPDANGTHRGNWKLRNDAGVTFGIGADANSSFWVQIVVGPTPTPAPSVYKTAKVDVEEGESVDLDEGEIVGDGSDRDMSFSVSGPDKFLEVRNGAEIVNWGDDVPDFEDCQGSDLSGDDIDLDDIAVGDWICFETSEGRIGRFEVEGISAGPDQILALDIRTWKQ